VSTPPLTATASLYQSRVSYTLRSGGQRAATLTRSPPCSPTLSAQCEGLALDVYRSCFINCASDCTRAEIDSLSPSGRGCAQCVAQYGCLADYQSELELCANKYDCGSSPGTTCEVNVDRPPIAYHCCPPGEQPCGGTCMSLNCPPLKAFAPASCRCECLPARCSKPLVQDPDSCLCRCPSPCPPTFIQDPITCACSCPDDLKDCQGVCRSLLHDRHHCGTCDNECWGDEDCCNGVCRSMTTPTHCGQCFHSCKSNETCCSPGGSVWGHCTTLTSDSECGACNVKCPSGYKCCAPPISSSAPALYPVPSYCSNLKTEAHCGACNVACQPNAVCCPPKGTTPAHCSTLTTNADCGTCGVSCTPPKTCVSQTCVCPPYRKECAGTCCQPGETCCGNQCCPAGRLCCNNVCCPSTSTDCCPGCNNFTVPPCPRATQSWVAWCNTHQGQKWASCPAGTRASFTCNPTLTSFNIGGLNYCCPPGCTGLNLAANQCTGCPP
jgi:hypothetical protein